MRPLEGYVPEGQTPKREPAIAPSADSSAALDVKTRVLIRLGGWLLDALEWTWRIQVFGRQDLLDRSPASERVVFVVWHGQLLPVALVHRQRAGALVSQHRDGEMITQIIQRLGMFGIRGSTTRGGARAILEGVRVLRSGADVIVTPDGPRGPRHSFAPGALVLAMRANTAVVPIATHADRVWQLKSWDRFEIPKPFAKLTVLYGNPMRVQSSDVRQLESEIPDFIRAIETNITMVNALAARR